MCSLRFPSRLETDQPGHAAVVAELPSAFTGASRPRPSRHPRGPVPRRGLRRELDPSLGRRARLEFAVTGDWRQLGRKANRQLLGNWSQCRRSRHAGEVVRQAARHATNVAPVTNAAHIDQRAIPIVRSADGREKLRDSCARTGLACSRHGGCPCSRRAVMCRRIVVTTFRVILPVGYRMGPSDSE